MTKRFFLTLAVLAMACLPLIAHAGEPKVGDEAPEIDAKDWINTTPLTLAALKDKVVVVEFWATWCPPCVKSIPHLIELNKKEKDKGVVVIGLSAEPIATVKPFATKMKMDYNVAAGSTSSKKYGVTGIPHAFVVVNGKVTWSGHPMDGLEDAVATAVKNKK